MLLELTTSVLRALSGNSPAIPTGLHWYSLETDQLYPVLSERLEQEYWQRGLYHHTQLAFNVLQTFHIWNTSMFTVLCLMLTETCLPAYMWVLHISILRLLETQITVKGLIKEWQKGIKLVFQRVQKQVPRPDCMADPCYPPTKQGYQAPLQNHMFHDSQNYLFGHTVYLHAIFKHLLGCCCTRHFHSLALNDAVNSEKKTQHIKWTALVGIQCTL